MMNGRPFFKQQFLSTYSFFRRRGPTLVPSRLCQIIQRSRSIPNEGMFQGPVMLLTAEEVGAYMSGHISRI